MLNYIRFLLYLKVTPMYTTDTSSIIDWYQYLAIWEALTPADRRVAEIVGVSEAFIARAISGRVNMKNTAQRKIMEIHHRFYTALVLNNLVTKCHLNILTNNYKSFYILFNI